MSLSEDKPNESFAEEQTAVTKGIAQRWTEICSILVAIYLS